MELLFFLSKVVVISLSGVMAPGPVTATAIAMGTRSRYAGTLIAIGHGIVEFPLMILIILGMDKLLKSANTKIIIGLAGGVFLLVMAIQMLYSIKSTENQEAKVTKSGPVAAGIILSAGNPYFLFWWATVGLTLAMSAKKLGVSGLLPYLLSHTGYVILSGFVLYHGQVSKVPGY